jgi:glycosyltransferase involved in cell wall biosynthesis
VDLPTLPMKSSSGPRTALFLSRIVHYKGLMNLIQAWAVIRPAEWTLKIAGPDQEGYQSECEAVVRDLKLQDTVKFVGPLYHEQKWQAYADADLFILPTFTENFGIVVAEALSSAVPVITTRGAPWRDLSDHQCGWWIDIGVTPLIHALREAFGMSEQDLKEMGARGRRLVMEKYAWPQIAKDIISVYKWMRKEGPRPHCMYEP